MNWTEFNKSKNNKNPGSKTMTWSMVSPMDSGVYGAKVAGYLWQSLSLLEAPLSGPVW